MIKRFAYSFVLLLFTSVISSLAQTAPAQYLWEAGIFAEDFRFGRISPTLDMPGAGARIAVFPTSPIQLEVESSYNVAQTFTTSWTNGFTTNLLTTHLRTWRALGGMKFDKRFSRRVRAFATAKVGFLDFNSSTANVPQGFTNPLTPATVGGTDLLVYGGGGLEYSFGRVGLRAEGGDDLYFDHGHRYNNVRITFGPTFRF